MKNVAYRLINDGNKRLQHLRHIKPDIRHSENKHMVSNNKCTKNILLKSVMEKIMQFSRDKRNSNTCPWTE